ncbi:hypothetical protein LENED_002067 [Lentinula edodes]|uniref:Uncharacterized protein n=1 Tax=Lentinula edodes TaxID=5353 RepID=A0A1Q3E022_LENED|nr:hypothetical protein LENED_002067 [Lentinula edodes]
MFIDSVVFGRADTTTSLSTSYNHWFQFCFTVFIFLLPFLIFVSLCFIFFIIVHFGIIYPVEFDYQHCLIYIR